jgi:proteasome lid subunit RPN8/RPN11
MSKPPKIVSETKREIEERAPPTRYTEHAWYRASGPSTSGKYGKIELYLSGRGADKMVEHALSYASKNLEVMGFLVGDVYRWKNKIYTVANDVVTTDLDATAVTVKFSETGFEKLFEALDKYGTEYIIVGWYHSHPDYTCFLSDTDIETQKKMFREPYHCAIVIDPINRHMKLFKLRGNEPVERRFVIYEDEWFEPGAYRKPMETPSVERPKYEKLVVSKRIRKMKLEE